MQFMSELEQGDWYILAAWLGVVVLLGAYALAGLLRKARMLLAAATARMAARRSAPKAAVHLPRIVAAAVARPRRDRAARSHWDCIADIVETGVQRAEAMAVAHSAAATQLDAAEYALRCLVKDCAKVMLMPAADTPARQAPPATRPMPLAA